MALALVLARSRSQVARRKAVTFLKERQVFPAKEIAAAFPKDGGRDGYALGVAKRPELIVAIRNALPKKE